MAPGGDKSYIFLGIGGRDGSMRNEIDLKTIRVAPAGSLQQKPVICFSGHLQSANVIVLSFDAKSNIF